MRVVLPAVLLLAAVAPGRADDVERLRGHGAYYVAGRVRCPLAGVGTRETTGRSARAHPSAPARVRRRRLLVDAPAEGLHAFENGGVLARAHR